MHSPQRRASSPLLSSQSRASPVNAGSRASPLSANARSSPVNAGARASPGTGGSPIPAFSIGSSSPKEESRYYIYLHAKASNWNSIFIFEVVNLFYYV